MGLAEWDRLSGIVQVGLAEWDRLSGISPVALLQEGFEVTYLPVKPSGLVDLDLLKDSIRPETVPPPPSPAP